MVFCIHTDFTNWPEITEEELVRLQSSIISVRYCAPRSAPSVGGDEYSGFPSGEGRGIQHGSLNLPINCAPLVIYVQRPEPLSSSISQWHCIGTAKISNIEVKLPPLGNLIPRSICSALLTIPVEQGWYRFPSAPGACRENCRGNEAPTPRCRIVWKDAELKNENQMDLFSVVHLSKPKQVTEGVRPLRDGEEPLLESTAGRTMELVLEQPEVDSTDVLAPTPLRSVPSVTVDPPRPDATSIGSLEDADVAEVDIWVENAKGYPMIWCGRRQRGAHFSLGLSTSTEEETPGASPTLAAKEVTETPPPNVEATSDSSAPVTHAAPSPPQTLGPKSSRPDYTEGRGDPLAKDTVADAHAEAESFESYAQNLCRGKNALLGVKGEEQHLLCFMDDLSPESGGLIESKRRSYANLSIDVRRGQASLGMFEVVPQARVRQKRLTLARHATEGAEAQPDYFLKPDVAQLQVPIFASPCDILNPFPLEKEVPLKESLEAHAIRLAKKKGVKGKAILCGVGAAHLPRSDGVPVSVATVSPKDSELLGKLEELDSRTQVAVQARYEFSTASMLDLGRSLIEELDMDADISLVPPHAEIQEKISDETEVLLEEEEATEIVQDQGSEVQEERLGHEEAIRLQEQINKEERKRIARDAEIAKQLQEEYDKAIKKEVVTEVDTAHVIDWNDPSVIRSSEGLKRSVKMCEEKTDDKRTRTEEVLELAQEQTDEEPKTDELSQEQLNQMVIIVQDEGMNVEALQTKYPIIE
ncbi:hypothetical protein Tco_1235739 [Tanacetum coccineum]